nr:hypothetical protein GZ11A10_10 [uncultured archaeon GZfos11A10]
MNANRNTHKLASILEKSLGREMVSPKRKISTLEELLEAFPDVGDLLIDGTERPTQRPKDDEKQKENYPRIEEDAYSEEYSNLRQEETNWLCEKRDQRGQSRGYLRDSNRGSARGGCECDNATGITV